MLARGDFVKLTSWPKGMRDKRTAISEAFVVSSDESSVSVVFRNGQTATVPVSNVEQIEAHYSEVFHRWLIGISERVANQRKQYYHFLRSVGADKSFAENPPEEDFQAWRTLTEWGK